MNNKTSNILIKTNAKVTDHTMACEPFVCRGDTISAGGMKLSMSGGGRAQSGWRQTRWYTAPPDLDR
jgi:hypothetical protein